MRNPYVLWGLKVELQLLPCSQKGGSNCAAACPLDLPMGIKSSFQEGHHLTYLTQKEAWLFYDISFIGPSVQLEEMSGKLSGKMLVGLG